MPPAQHNARLAMVVCTPLAMVTGPDGSLIYDPISPLWHRKRHALAFGTNINVTEFVADGLEVGDARSQVASRCLKMNPRPEFLFFLDSDVLVPPDAVTKLFYYLKTRPKIDIACGVYTVKGAFPQDPLIYRENGEGAYWDWAVGDILTTEQHNIRSIHMGLTLIRCSLFDRMIEAGLVHGDGTDQDDEPFFKTENFRRDDPEDGLVGTMRGTEDIYFCTKARKLPGGGCQILVDTSVLAGHHDKSTGRTHGLAGNTIPVERAKWLTKNDRKEANDEKLKLAIDLGAGFSRREWPGHRTYTLDAHKDSNCDYCQELTQLNLPSRHFDLVASRHAFEHVGRWQQERLWEETYRIAAYGAKLEVIVPSLQWAAEKIAAGQMDFDVMNVLYGSQDLEEGWGRDGNHHLFGYTKEIAVALAEKAGWIDVVCTDWRDDPGVLYHMMITAHKPCKKEVVEKQDESFPVTKGDVATVARPEVASWDERGSDCREPGDLRGAFQADGAVLPPGSYAEGG